MYFPNGQVSDQIDLMNELVDDLIDNDVYTTVNRSFMTQDLSERALNDAPCLAEDALKNYLGENSGFLRLQQAFRYLGFKGNDKPPRRFNNNEEGKLSRKLIDGSEVLWEDRPDDVYEEESIEGEFKGWTINNFIQNVLPWAKALQTDRILDSKSPFEIKPLAIAIMNSKGGTYKTTTAVNFAVMCALTGFRVLVIDGDPQSTASTLLGYPMAQHPVTHPHSLYETLLAFQENESDFDAMEYIRPALFNNISIITGSTDGSLLDLLLYKDPSLLDRFMSHIKQLGEFDLIITDTRPQSTYQDFAQYHCADILIDTLPANTTGIGSTKQGLLNFINYCVKSRNQTSILDQRNRLSILTPTGIETDSRNISKNVYLKLLTRMNDSDKPILSCSNYIPKSNNIARAASFMQTVFQETNINVASSKTKKSLDPIAMQFEEIFEKAIVPHYLRFRGTPIDSDWLKSVTKEIGEPLNYSDEEFRYQDLGFAWAIIRPAEPLDKDSVMGGSRQKKINPRRYLTASDLGLESGHQIVMKDGKHIALDYDLNSLKALTPYVHRHNSAS